MVSSHPDGAIVIWQDKRDAMTKGWDIYAQRVSRESERLWTANGVAVCSGSGDQITPSVAASDDSGAVAAWWDKRDSVSYELYCQKIDKNGQLLWNSSGIRLSSGTSESLQANMFSGDYDIAISSDGSGGLIAAWTTKRNGSYQDLYAQRVSSSGYMLWGSSGTAVCTATGHQKAPVITGDGTGGAVIAWQDYRGSSWDIYALRLSSSGQVYSGWSSGGVRISLNSKDDTNPSICSDGASGAVVAWEYENSSDQTDIYIQRISGAGALQYGGANKAVCSASDMQYDPLVIKAAPDGSVIAGWRDFRNESYEGTSDDNNLIGDIYVDRLNSSGSSVWTSNGIEVSNQNNAQKNLQMVSDEDGGVLLAFEDHRKGVADITCQHIIHNSSSPALSGPTSWGGSSYGTFLTSYTFAQEYPFAIFDGVEGIIVAFEHPHDGSTDDIYIQRMSGSDNVIPEAITSITALAGSGADEVILQWTAPDEDAIGAAGKPVTYYKVKYSTISPAGSKNSWWEQSSFLYEQSWTPLSPGSTEQHSVYLQGSLTYFFMIQGVDESNNKADINTSGYNSSDASPDNADPSKISDLDAVTGSTEGKLTLSWTAPEDNAGQPGPEYMYSGTYLVAYSTSASYSFSPASPDRTIGIENRRKGTAETVTLTGLLPGATYYCRIWTQDEVPNTSPVSFGATQYAQLDITAPGAITNLTPSQVSGSSITLRLVWTAPGDDSYVNYSTYGPRGFSGRFLIHYSSTAISSPSSSAAQLSLSTSGVYPGQTRSMVLTGLEDDTVYYFYAWTEDETGNISQYSNYGSTKTLDLTAPSAMTSLDSTPGELEGRVILSWSAPGDNNTEGTASRYEIRWSTYGPFSWASVPSGQRKTKSVSGPYGIAESDTITGLTNGLTYYFELHSFDEVPNEQPLCNTSTTYATTDIVAPGKILDLSAAAGNNFITLSWTSPGDNGYSDSFSVGGGTYIIRYSSVALISNTTDWNNALPVTSLSPAPTLPSPLNPLAATQIVVSGLENFVKHWFAIKTKDEIPNFSDMSNVASAVPSPDTTAPSAQLTVYPPSTIYMTGNRASVSISATDTGGSAGIYDITLYYNIKGAATTSVKLYSSSPDTSVSVSGYIPASYVTTAGFEYYLTVKDVADNWWYSSGQSGQYPASVSPTATSVSVSRTYSQTVTAAGATVAVPDGNASDGQVSVTVPSAALTEDISLSITQSDETAAPKLNGAAPVSYWTLGPDAQSFKLPVTVTLLYFDKDQDSVVDSTSINETGLKMFYWDGFDYRPVGGTVNVTANTVSAATMHFSNYALFESNAVLAAEDTLPMRKIITPNGDGYNDLAVFSGLEAPYELKIFTVRGRLIREFEDTASPVWDGTDEDGEVLESGAYIYQLEKDGDTVTGVIVIAK
jgi:gliding motility-associated-like protein